MADGTFTPTLGAFLAVNDDGPAARTESMATDGRQGLSASPIFGEAIETAITVMNHAYARCLGIKLGTA